MAERFSAPEAESRHPWLAAVLDAFHVSDQRTEAHLARLAKAGRTPACRAGCHACCLDPAVPFTEPELNAIAWYATEALAGAQRDVVRRQLEGHAARRACPFLVEGSCAVYPVRPLSCRHYLVARQACVPDEDPAATRPGDVIGLPRETVVKPAVMRLMDFHGFPTTRAKEKAFDAGFMVRHARLMRDVDWSGLASAMAEADAAGGPPQGGGL